MLTHTLLYVFFTEKGLGINVLEQACFLFCFFWFGSNFGQALRQQPFDPSQCASGLRPI